jgi:trehalose 6-phosphate phosphatase
MKHLLSPDGQDALRALVGRRTLFAFDFDGTLAPIVWHPEDARIAIGLRTRLARLAARAPVAVISGRALDDLRHRLPGEIGHCVGNHGNEGMLGPNDAASLRAVCRAWTMQLQEMLADRAAPKGIFVENKGATLSVHYRQARDRTAAAQWLGDRIDELSPPARVIGGKLVLNLLPPGARTKFEALSDLARHESAERVLFVGDDDTDEVVFAQAPPDWLTVRVDLDATSKAAFFLQQQSEVTILLDQLLALLETRAQETRDDFARRRGITNARRSRTLRS